MVGYGLQCWNSRGQKTLDVSDRLTRVLGVIEIPLVSGYITYFDSPEFIGHEPFVHMALFNSITSRASPQYNWNNEVNGTFMQLVYERVSSTRLKISLKLFYGPKATTPATVWSSPDVAWFTQNKINVLVGCY